jgi:type VI secretion system protein ImpB
MSKSSDGQKFIGESRAPRVQIEYDVELYGSQKKVELPFVAGVMADLSGDNTEVLAPVEDRNFVDIDPDTFDTRMAEIQPTANFYVQNDPTQDGTLIDVSLGFKSMSDFDPAEVVKRIPELAVLLEARNQLKELITYMDGKAAAEDVIQELLRDPKWNSILDSARPSATAAAVETADQGDQA